MLPINPVEVNPIGGFTHFRAKTPPPKAPENAVASSSVLPPGSDSPMIPEAEMSFKTPWEEKKISKELWTFRNFVEGLNPDEDIDVNLGIIARELNAKKSHKRFNQLKGIYTGNRILDDTLINAIQTAHPHNTWAKTMKPIWLSRVSVKKGSADKNSAVGRFHTFKNTVESYYPGIKTYPQISHEMKKNGKELTENTLKEMGTSKRSISGPDIEMFRAVFPKCPAVNELMETEPGSLRSKGKTYYIGTNYYGDDPLRPRTPGSEARKIQKILPRGKLTGLIAQHNPRESQSWWRSWLGNRVNPKIRTATLSDKDADIILMIPEVQALINDGIINEDNLKGGHTDAQKEAMRKRFQDQENAGTNA